MFGSFGLAGSASGANSPAAFTYLQCDLTKASLVVGFALNPPRAVDALNPNVALGDVKVNDHKISFTSSNRFHAHWLYSQFKPEASVTEASSMQVEINRLTGIASVSFSPEYGPREIALCRAKKDGPWCEFTPVTTTVSGSCMQVRRRF